MKNEKIEQLLSDKTFAQKICQLETIEEVQEAFKEKGIEISLEEIELIGSLVAKMIETGKTELSKDDLENIAGGVEWKHVGYGFSKGITSADFTHMASGNSASDSTNLGINLALATYIVGGALALGGIGYGAYKIGEKWFKKPLTTSETVQKLALKNHEKNK